MIVEVQKVHSGMADVVFYLYGPGNNNEHTNQQAIASSVGLDVVHGELLTKDQQRHLVDQLNAPKVVFDVKADHVYHLSISTNGDRDRDLTMAEWADVAETYMADMGFDDGGVSVTPWVAVHHGKSGGLDGGTRNDHIHIAVSLVREDGAMASRHNDFKKAATVAQKLEKRYGLVLVDGRTGGAVRHNSKADIEQAKREGASETQRDALHRKVRAAKGLARNEAEFVQGLWESGVVPSPWVSPESGAVEGYSVSLKPESGMEPKWFGGSRLAKDLSLPKLRAQWEPGGGEVDVWKSQKGGLVSEVEVSADEWREAASTVEQATDRLGRIPLSDSSGLGAAADRASEVLAVLSERVEPVAGPIAANVKTLAGTAQLKPSGGSNEWLTGVAMVASQATLTGSKQNAMGWLLVLARLQELSRVVEQLHESRNELSRSADLYRQRQEVGLAATTLLTVAKGYEPGVLVELRSQANSPVGTIEQVYGANVSVRWAGVGEATTLEVRNLRLRKKPVPRAAPSVHDLDKGFER